MAFSRQELKVVSIIQLIMVAIFLALGLVDHFEVRYRYTSFTLMPCWIAALVLPVGIMGLVLVSMPRPSSALNYALRSVSMGCVAVAIITAEPYIWALNNLMAYKYPAKAQLHEEAFPLLADKDAKVKFLDEEKTMIAIHALIIIFSIFEIILAVASAWGGDIRNQSQQANPADGVYHQIEAGQIPMQFQPYFPAQPMVAIPVSAASHSINQ